MKKKLFFTYLAISSVLVYSCYSQTSKLRISEGKYVQKEEPCISINFIKNKFEFRNDCDNDPLADYRCCDIIAKGDYSIDSERGLLELSSSDSIINNLLNVSILEKISNASKDSIRIIFDNPITTNNAYHKELIYEVDLYYPAKSVRKKTDENSIAFKKIPNLETINVTVYPKTDMSLSQFGITKLKLVSEFLNVKNSESNIFEISTPDLNYEFLSFKRLRKDYIKIIDDNILFWDGKTYVKEN